MSGVKTLYKLPPQQTTTTDPAHYVAAWRALAAPILRNRPGWKLIAFDPDLVFENELHGRTFSISVEVARLIGELDLG